MVRTIPPSIVDWLLDRSEEWLLSDSKRSGTDTDLIVVWHSLLSRAIQYSLIREMYEQAGSDKLATDAERAIRLLTMIRQTMLTQQDIPHPLTIWPSVVSGLGWCNQINEAVGILLAQEFGYAEIIGITDALTGAGHSIGRVWSKSMSTWLYFDGWADEAVVFSINENHKTIVHAKQRPMMIKSLKLSDEQALQRMYTVAFKGKVLGHFPSTLGKYLLFRVRRGLYNILEKRDRIFHDFPNSGRLTAPIITPKHIGREYLQARIKHLRGDLRGARNGYAAVELVDPGSGSLIGQAAKRFKIEIDLRLSTHNKLQYYYSNSSIKRSSVPMQKLNK